MLSPKSAISNRVAALAILVALFVPAEIAIARPRYRETGMELVDRTNAYNQASLEMARQFKAFADSTGRDRAALLSMVVTFVQTLAYVAEAQDPLIPEPLRGVMDWWQYPDETLIKGGGDCEDLAILCFVMLQSLGYDLVFVTISPEALHGVEGHISVAVEVNPDQEFNYDINGKKYAYIECTNVVPVGFVPEPYRVEAEFFVPAAAGDQK